MYKRQTVTMYTYEITLDGKTSRKEYSRKLNCEKTITKATADGHTMDIKFIGSYLWEE